MNAPLIDPRTREDILNEISSLAMIRTPEWRLNRENPDAGTVLALIWADMLYGTIERVNRLTENYMIHLYNSLNLTPLPAVPSRGFLCFTASLPALVPSGSTAACGDTIFATTTDLYTSTAAITDMYVVMPNTCCRCEGIQDVYLFDCKGENHVSWTIEHPFAFNVSKGGSLGLVFDCEATDKLNDPGCAAWTFSETGLRLNILNQQAFIGAGIRDLGLLPQNAGLKADVVYANGIQLPDEGFFPFGERFMVYDEVYFSCDEAFEKHGAYVELRFTAQMTKFPIEGYPEPQPSYKPVMRLRDLNIPEEFDILISGIAWEYFNGTGWAALTTTPHRDIFFSTDRVEQVIGFICPDDFDITTIGAHEKRHIRARITQVENAFKMYGCYWSPFIESLRFSYVYDSPLIPARVSCFQNMEETVSPERIIDCKFTEPSMYLSIDNPSPRGSVLVELEECSGSHPLRWEYYTSNGWSALYIDDGTLGFVQTGIVTYFAPLPWEKTPLFGKTSYWVRVVCAEGDGHLLRPKLKRIWGNAVQAVCAEGGEQGNAAPQSVVTLMQAINGIDTVINPLPMEGGGGEESYENTVKRFLTERRVTVC